MNHRVSPLTKKQLADLEKLMREQHWMGNGHKCINALISASKAMGDSCLIARLLATIRNRTRECEEMGK
jgi:hypothetical protein